VSSQVSTSPRQRLNARQAATLGKIFTAAEELLDESGHEALTIRMVADRAGVSPATAYTYVASKDHLFAELFWRRLEAQDHPPLRGRGRLKRLQEVTRQLAELIASRPAIASAATKSLLGQDPEVSRLRVDIGLVLLHRFRDALGADVAPELLATVAYAFNGLLLQAGMGLMSYDDLADELDNVTAVIMKGHR
jgi:AcrR family transcriptional regulator